MGVLHRFSLHEDELIRRFHQHPFFAHFSALSDRDLKEYLTQKWFLSQNFVPWYDRAINGLNDEEAKAVLKKIVQDETPLGAPSHREDLLADLEFIGISREKVLTAKPRRDTLKAIHKLNELVAYSGGPNHDLRVMSALRTAGEILVAEEYRHVVPELERRYGLTPERSRFYAPHFYHDRKDSETGQHTHSFESVLERMISSEDKLQVATESAERAFRHRLHFHDQFYGRLRIVRRMQEGLAIAAGIAIIATGAYFARTIDSESNTAPLARTSMEVTSSGTEFYLDADRRLLQQYRETGNSRYLKNIGTFEAAREVWGEGP